MIGVECSDVAVKSFFEEQNIKYSTEHQAAHQHYSSNSIEILLGDFFTLNPAVLHGVTDVFDRAALIALPEQMRQQYVSKMVELLVPGTRTLLVTLTYPQHEMDGPPFSVSEEEVSELYAADFKIEKLLVKDALADEPRFVEKGLTSLKETVYKLTRL